jgi:hypothetical protein
LIYHDRSIQDLVNSELKPDQIKKKKKFSVARLTRSIINLADLVTRSRFRIRILNQTGSGLKTMTERTVVH